MRARFVSAKPENISGTIISFYFKPQAAYRYEAGQYTSLTISHPNADNRGQSRTMTLSSAPDDNLLRITTRIDRSDQSSYKHALLALKPGSEVTVTDAMGDLVLPLDTSLPLTFVAGGVGIASYIGMIRHLLGHGEQRDITLMYALRDPSDSIFHKDFKKYGALAGLKSVLYMSTGSPHNSWPGSHRNRRLQAADIVQSSQPNAQIYLSGSESMVESLRRNLQSTYGIPQYRLVFDYYDGYIDC